MEEGKKMQIDYEGSKKQFYKLSRIIITGRTSTEIFGIRNNGHEIVYDTNVKKDAFRDFFKKLLGGESWSRITAA